MKKLPWVLIGAGGLVAAALLLRPKANAALRSVLPNAALPYADFIAEAAASTGIDPLLIAAVGDHETRWGWATGYVPQGDPAGTGDWTPRSVSSWGTAMPPDGLGWGRGLMQLDYGAQAAWHAANPGAWADPRRNILRGAQILREAQDFFRAQGVTGDLLTRATLAAYNNRYYAPGIWAYMQRGQDPDAGTTRGAYSQEVLARYAMMVS